MLVLPPPSHLPPPCKWQSSPSSSRYPTLSPSLRAIALSFSNPYLTLNPTPPHLACNSPLLLHHLLRLLELLRHSLPFCLGDELGGPLSLGLLLSSGSLRPVCREQGGGGSAWACSCAAAASDLWREQGGGAQPGPAPVQRQPQTCAAGRFSPGWLLGSSGRGSGGYMGKECPCPGRQLSGTPFGTESGFPPPTFPHTYSHT